MIKRDDREREGMDMDKERREGNREVEMIDGRIGRGRNG
jgi:hypothetical protein